jgi:hypothetical protein
MIFALAHERPPPCPVHRSLVRSASEPQAGFVVGGLGCISWRLCYPALVQRYLADYRAVFADRAQLDDLMDCLDVFVRAGWPAAQSLTFKLGEIWR